MTTDDDLDLSNVDQPDDPDIDPTHQDRDSPPGGWRDEPPTEQDELDALSTDYREVD